MDRMAQAGLVTLALIFACVALIGWFAPDLLFEPIGVALATPDGRAEIRAAYGGHFFGWALVFATGAVRPGLRRWALAGAAVVLWGFVLGRVVSWGLDGAPGMVGIAIALVESCGAGAALGLWWATGPRR